CQHYYSTPYTC
nr:immunoglobulin light chain junction region [Macaca mulatta]